MTACPGSKKLHGSLNIAGLSTCLATNNVWDQKGFTHVQNHPLSRRPLSPEPPKKLEPSHHLTAQQEGRRKFLSKVIAISTGAFALAFAVPALAIRTLSFEKREVAAGDPLVYASGDRTGQPVQPDQLQPGESVQAYPAGKDDANNLVEIVRIGDTEDAESFVAFSAICTHLGCVVNARLDPDSLIVCPCHASQFDPLNNAEPVSGPAARRLPALPITFNEDGGISAAGGFDGPIGVG
jgi:Rieske Fe-S protein